MIWPLEKWRRRGHRFEVGTKPRVIVECRVQSNGLLNADLRGDAADAIQAAQRELAELRAELAAARAVVEVGRGCSNHGCRMIPPRLQKGMRTNGGCKCQGDMTRALAAYDVTVKR